LAQLRTAAVPPPAISGGSLAVSEDGTQVVAADPDRDQVYVIDVKTLGVRKLALPRGSEPGRVAFDHSGGAHVALRGAGKLLRVNLASADISTQTELCTQPRGLAFDAKNNTIVATCMDGQIVSFDAASHREVERQTLPQDLRDVIVTPSGARSVIRYRSAELLAVQGATVKSTTRPRQALTPGNPFSSMGAPDRSSDAPPVPMATPATPASLAGLQTFSPALAWRGLPSQRGGVWMLHQQSLDGEVAVAQGGYGAGCQTITTGAVTEFDADGTPMRTMAVSLMGLSVDVAVSPDEKWVAVASPGGYARSMPSVQVYATNGLQGAQPPGGCPTPPMATAGGENQTVAVAFDSEGVLYALSREPAELQIYDMEPVTPALGLPAVTVLTRRATIGLDATSMRDTGHDLFHADVGQGLACASCHGEALDDGHVWNFQKIGPRRTQNMRGGFLATAPFHWDGDMVSMGHLVDDVMTGRMGGFPVEASFATALGKWIDVQPALKLPGRDMAAVERGKTLFGSGETKCATCHNGANLTNNESHDVGTGGTFQVPGLLGLALRGPYMHNGCAKTLEDRFEAKCGGGDDHGTTSKLSATQRADLIAYLNTL
jgi:DNA-binding beta-propeller fold protein YncE/cytochrome c553